jgi:hypothetical protein
MEIARMKIPATLLAPARAVFSFLALALVVGLFIWGYGIYNAAQDAKDSAWKAEMHAKADSSALAVKRAAVARGMAQDSARSWIVYRDRVLHPPAGSPLPSAEVRACVEKANATLLTPCARALAADTAAIRALQSQLRTAMNPPPTRRVQAYGEALWGFTSSDSAGKMIGGFSPVIRLGVTARVAGPVSLSAAGQLTLPSAGHAGVGKQLLGGVRINF